MGIYDNAMAARDSAHFKREDAEWDRADAVGKEAQDILNLFAEGKEIWLAGLKRTPQELVELLIDRDVDCSKLLILMFSEDKAARSTAFKEVSGIFDDLADEQLEYEAEERRNDF